jgi:hypothetical protein
MNARRISSAILVATITWCTPDRLHGQSEVPGSFSTVEVSRERRYRVDARVRPLLFWIRKATVGRDA